MSAESVLAPVAPPRIVFIQILRGISALLVVWAHLSAWWLADHDRRWIGQDLWTSLIARPFHIYGDGGLLGVSIFFLISGYIITHTSLREGRPDFAIKRLLRIFPLLIVATAIAAGCLALSQWLLGEGLLGVHGGTVGHWLKAAFLLDGFVPDGRAISTTWTLLVELFFYTLVFVVLRLSKTRVLVATWIMIGIWTVTTVASIVVGVIHNADNYTIAVTVGLLIIGRFIYLLQHRLVGPLEGGLSIAATALIFVLLYEVVAPGFLFTPGFEPIANYALAALVFVLLMRVGVTRVVQPFAFLGDISYSLYLIHLPVGMLVLNLLGGTTLPYTVNFLVALAVALGVSFVTYRLVERPTQKLARALIRRGRLGVAR